MHLSYLVEKDYIPNETINEIKRLNPKNVYLIGGTDVVSEKVRRGYTKYY